MSAAEATDGIRVMRFAPAKLNLTLAVVGRRDDGFHALHSVMVPLALGDTVEMQRATGPHDTLSIDGLAFAATSENLVLRAIAGARAELGTAAQCPPLAAQLTKRIPVAAGLGGGSSDAAATVAAALAAWGAELPAEALRRIAAALGSDVPFFLARGVAVVTGRGEFVEPLPAPEGEAPAVLIVTPRLALSTAEVFAAYSGGARPASGPRPASGALPASERLAADLRAGLTVRALVERAEELATANDLLPAALSIAPSLVAFRAALRRIVGRPVGQSGSGPTAWVLYPSLAAARKAARFVRLGVIDGSLPQVGDGAPFVVATTLVFAPTHAETLRAGAPPESAESAAAPVPPPSINSPTSAPAATLPGAGDHNRERCQSEGS
jgi:4-diphosphocytidyl-2-C-methyl-D-erythritol kinase